MNVKKKLTDALMAQLAMLDPKIDEQVLKTATYVEEVKREWEQGITENGNTAMVDASYDMYQKAINAGYPEERAFQLAMSRTGL